MDLDLCNPLKRRKERENASEKIRRPDFQGRKLVWKVEVECIWKSWLKRNCLMLIVRCVRAEWCDDCVEIRELQCGAVIDGGTSGVLEPKLVSKNLGKLQGFRGATAKKNWRLKDIPSSEGLTVNMFAFSKRSARWCGIYPFMGRN